MGWGLGVLGLSGAGMKALPKGAGEKMLLVWWLRRRTTVSLRWLSERLAMGHVSRVSQAIGVVKRRPDGKLKQLTRKLIRLEHGQK